MTKDIEREAFLEYWRENNLPYDGDDADKEKCFEYWQAAKALEAKKLEGCVVVPINNTTIVAIEKMVEQQVEASGITEDVFRLDGEKILNAAVEAARGGNE